MNAQITKLWPAATLALVAITLSSPSSANLIVNGEFEDQLVPAGWTHLQDAADGWQGSDIEIWHSGYNGVTSYSGPQHGELNSHGGSGGDYAIHQTFDTAANVEYLFSFAYRARANSDEVFEFSLYDGAVNGTEIVSQLLEDHSTDDWSLFNTTFTASGATTTLEFVAITPGSGTVGNFLDAIVVTAAPVIVPDVPVPTPGSLALLGLGLLGLSRFTRSPGRR